MTRVLLKLVQLLAALPLPVLRALGVLLGYALYGLVRSRRHVVRTNLRLCFPALSPRQVERRTRATFVCFAQAWLDRGWLWHGDPRRTRSRLRLTGAVEALQGEAPAVLFAPHFVGLDAGWTALTQQLPRRFATIYTDQENVQADAWILRGRQRFGQVELFGREKGVRPVLAALKQGALLYLLPDMNFGPEESVFVPFYGVPAATVPSLSRFARLAHARVHPVLSRITPWGYEVEVLPAWSDFPSADALADTACMNLRLQTYIDAMPEQYYWVHRRFKDRPEGALPPY